MKNYCASPALALVLAGFAPQTTHGIAVEHRANDAAVPGQYRRLAFDSPRAKDDAASGNALHDGSEPAEAHTPVTNAAPAAETAAYKPFVIKTTDGRCAITIDTGQAPELRAWAETQLAPALAEWYPKIAALLHSDEFTAPAHCTITIRPGRGVAGTTGTHIVANATWLQKEIGRQAIGALVHETVHVVQQYGWGRRHNPHPARNPGWLVEGVADYIRWFLYEPQSHGADLGWMRRSQHLSPRYDAGYRVTANFLNWVTKHHDPRIVAQLNAAMRDGNYETGLWKKYTGKTLEELGDEWKKNLQSELPHESKPNTAATKGT